MNQRVETSATPMINIHPVTPSDVPAICALARTIWQATYTKLISQAQIDYMLADFYAPARICAQPPSTLGESPGVRTKSWGLRTPASMRISANWISSIFIRNISVAA